DVYGYEYQRTSYGFEVLPETLDTQLFHINYLDVQRTGKSYTALATGQISEQISGTTSSTVSANGPSNYSTTTHPSGSLVDTRSVVNFWKELEVALKSMVGTDNGHNVIVNPQAGLILVKAYPHELRQVCRYLDSIQKSVSRQVILEAKILEVQLN